MSSADAGDILIGDSHGNKFHVVVFANDGSLLGEFECPHVKVGEVTSVRRGHNLRFSGVSMLWAQDYQRGLRGYSC